MRWLLAIAAFVLAGCAESLPVELEVLSAGTSEHSTNVCCLANGATYSELECPDGPIHGVQVRAPGTSEDDLAPDRWRLVWADGHRTGVSVAHTAEAPHHSASARVLIAYLAACQPPGVSVIDAVELRDASGRVVGRAAV